MRTADQATKDAIQNSRSHLVADLYTVFFRDGTSRWTSADTNITFAGNTWLCSGPIITRANAQTSVGLSVDTLDITLAPGAVNTPGGTPLKQAAVQGGFDNVRVLVRRAYMTSWGTPAGLVTLFDGSVTEVVPGSTEMRLVVKSVMAKLSEQIPRRLLQPQCPFRVFDSSCGLSSAAFTDLRGVLAGSTETTLKLTSPSTNAVVGGYITVVTGIYSGTVRTIKAVAGSDVTLATPLPGVPLVGNTYFYVTRGCDKTRAGCRALSNIARFGGFPDTPKPESVNS